MSCHYSQCTCFDHFFVNFSIAFIPFFAGKSVHTCHKMLITFIHTVSREMFYTCRHAFFFCTADICFSHIDHGLKIGTEGTHIGDRIVIVQIQIHNRSKRPVHTDCRSLAAAYLSKLICSLHISGRCGKHFSSVIRSFYCRSVSAVFQIRSC